MKPLSLLPLLALFLTVQQECHWSDSGGGCQTIVKSFDSKETLGEYLKSQENPIEYCQGGDCIQVYEAKRIKYKVKIKTEEREKRSTETIETGRSISFCGHDDCGK